MTNETNRPSLLVLVVDDNAINRLLLAKTVEAFGGRVETAENGAEALDKITAGHFDLVFMDIAMPVLDGMEATKQARARGDTLPVVAVTAHFGAGDMAELSNAGFDGLIAKPFDIQQVFAHLGAVGS
jgi:CheY-like chemotaxis protein